MALDSSLNQPLQYRSQDTSSSNAYVKPRLLRDSTLPKVMGSGSGPPWNIFYEGFPSTWSKSKVAGQGMPFSFTSENTVKSSHFLCKLIRKHTRLSCVTQCLQYVSLTSIPRLWFIFESENPPSLSLSLYHAQYTSWLCTITATAMQRPILRPFLPGFCPCNF